MVGKKFVWNNREWTVKAVKGALVFLTTPGLPTQTMNYLRVADLIEQQEACKERS